ncbi:MAG: hypothetical protein Kow0096_25630 [Thiohalomonadaceae bacterium]
MSFYWLVWFIIPGLAAAYYVYQDGIKRMPLALGVHPGWWLFWLRDRGVGIVGLLDHASLCTCQGGGE